MYKLFILFLLQSVLVSDSVIVNSYGQPLATSYVYRVDGNEKGHGYGYGYSKNYGYGKVIVTTYLAPMPPQQMPASSYSTYIIHPVNVKGCVHNTMDSENSGSFHHNYETDRDDIDSMNMGEYEEEQNTEYNQPRFNMQDNDYENMIDTDTDAERYRGWYEDYRKKFSGEDGQGYWNKLKEEFDAYYDDKYREFFGNDGYQEEDSDEGDYGSQFKNRFGEDYGDNSGEDDDYYAVDDDYYEVKPEFKFNPDSGGFGYRYELEDKYGRKW